VLQHTTITGFHTDGGNVSDICYTDESKFSRRFFKAFIGCTAYFSRRKKHEFLI
jgi:hypothetical protein